MASFFRDLAWIRDRTFTNGLIRRAFRESDIVPPNPKKVKENMRKYYKQPKEITALTDDIGEVLPSIRVIDQALDLIAYKAELGPLSSPTRHLLDRTRADASKALH